MIPVTSLSVAEYTYLHRWVIVKYYDYGKTWSWSQRGQNHLLACFPSALCNLQKSFGRQGIYKRYTTDHCNRPKLFLFLHVDLDVEIACFVALELRVVFSELPRGCILEMMIAHPGRIDEVTDGWPT